jgi:hypothetical protein
MTEGVGGVGGAIANNGGNLKLVDDTLSGNAGTDSGGAIYNGSGSLSMSGCSVSGQGCRIKMEILSRLGWLSFVQ